MTSTEQMSVPVHPFFKARTRTQLIHGDCFTQIKTLKDASIDLVITSPPYADMKTYVDFKGIPPDEYVDWIMPLIHDIYRVLKPNGSFILNINDKVVQRFRHPYVFDLVSRIHKDTQFKMFERLFWNKMKGLPVPNRFGDRVEFVFWFVKGRDFTFDIDAMRTPYTAGSEDRMKSTIPDRFVRTETSTNTKRKAWIPNEKGAMPSTLVNICSETRRQADTHIAVFPEALVKYFLLGCTRENDTVLDPFMGTGTTAVVCKKHNRTCIGFEAQKSYVDVANERLFKTDLPSSGI